MRRIVFPPLLWGFFLSTVAFSAPVAPPLKSALPARLSSNLQVAPASEIQARILAIRVEFQQDSLSTTTGDGTFADHSWIPGDAVVDQFPHNRAYFEDHLTFLKNYFTEISDSNATVDTFAVYPQEPDSAYRLPHQMWHYNHNTTPEDLNYRLALLFVDAWTTAKNSPGFNALPENFNTFVIYHAGTGQDFVLDFDQTPHDIPSAYFTLENLRESLNDSTFNGVLVNGSYVTSGLLLPEAERQTEVDIEIALNGTEVLLFGHALGLPALYNTETGQSGVGQFDFMDQGSGNFAGMVPSRPSAWTRVFMGWAEAEPLHPLATPEDFVVNVTGYGTSADSAHEIYRVDLNENEYYLIENRNYDPDSLGFTYARDRDNHRLKINPDYSVEVMDDSFGVIVSVDNYDFGLPGAGILIWHVDERVIEENYASNRVNADPDHRGVMLIEADGAQDIGQSYGFFSPGWGTELGWSRDFFFAGNEEFLAANPAISTVTFYDESHPGTRTHDGANTGLFFNNFTAISPVMHFMLRNSWAQVGFPQQLVEPSGSLSPSVLDFDSDSLADWILTVTPNGAIQAFDDSGRAQGNWIETGWQNSLLGDSSQTSDTLLIRLDSIRFTPAIDVMPDSFFMILPSTAGKVYQLSYILNPPQIRLDSLYLADPVSCLPLIINSGDDRRWFIGNEAGLIAAYEGINDQLLPNSPFDDDQAIVGLCCSNDSANASIFALGASGGAALLSQTNIGNTKWVMQLPFDPAFQPISIYHIYQQNYNRWDLVAVGSGGEVAFLDPVSGDYRPGFPMNVGMTITAPPAACDLDRDGRIEVILTGANHILGVASNGTLVANWPTILDPSFSMSPIQSPLALSQLGSGDPPEIYAFFGWSDGSLEARNRYGQQADKFPRTTGSAVTSAPLLVQMDADVKPELIALDENGALFCWHLDQIGSYDDQRRPWNGLQNGNPRQGLCLDTLSLATPEPNLLVTTKVYPWPNPARETSHIRYKMGQSGIISVRIFDGAGDLVKELKGIAEAGLEGELLWNLNNVSSGIYFGRVEAEANGQKEHTFIKIAVVK